MHQILKIAHRHSLANFHRRLGHCMEFRSGNQFCPFCHIENRCSLASFDRKESAHKNRTILRGSGKIAAATTENRAIWVHSDPVQVTSCSHWLATPKGAKEATTQILWLLALTEIDMLDRPAPELQEWKNFSWCTVEMSRIFRKCLATMFQRRKIGNVPSVRRQLRASSGGSSDATSKASFPLHNTEEQQHQGL